MVIEQKFKAGEEPDPTEYLFVSMEQKIKDQSKPYDAKTSVWVPDDSDGFVIGEMKGTKGEMVIVDIKHEEKFFKKDLVAQVNPPKYEKTEDMSNLTYLSDASVLHNLKQRYYARLIYTYSGLFCVAINPYKRYPIYTVRAMKIYMGKRRNEVPPHIFAIAEGAYQNMMTAHENQSILITGESGAGKTENTKKVIAYFAQVGASAKTAEKKVSLEDQIVQTNPVLESFGNAKTTRNDNSSRFGKFIRIHFGPTGKLAGGDIESYLLEKARCISQMPLERCYHIFYQLHTGAISGLKDKLFLGQDIYQYPFCSKGKVTVPSIDDFEEMKMTHEAFEILQFPDEERMNIYKVTASCMHMGAMKFKQKGREEQAEPDGLEVGTCVAKLLGVDGVELYKNICKPKIKVGSEFVTKGMNVVQCGYTLGAMTKSIYDRLFKYLIKRCNDTLDTKQKKVTFSGVLDIAGFEIFDENGFDQLCINFTNEKLQQFFNHHMFVLEQEEYKTEGLDWTFEDFGMDLQACISLMEMPMGVFAILEEQSLFPKATDATFIDMLKTNLLGKSPCFVKPKPPKPGQKDAHFAVAHYAGTVPYNVNGWLEKNKDPLNDTVVDQYKKGSNPLVATLYIDHPGQSGDVVQDTGKGGKGGGRKKGGGFVTVSSNYREQLNNLMTTLRATYPSFIRCIIPNEVKQPGLIDSHLVMHQLTCNGVLEGIRICRKGFPNRMLYKDFKHRYIILAVEQMRANEKDDKKMATSCFEHISLEQDKWRVGHTKVFFRAGVLGYLEELRDEKVSKILTYLQSQIRTFLSRRQYKTLMDQRAALQVLQRSLRNYMKNKKWPWFNLMQKVIPLCAGNKEARELKKLQEKTAKMEEMQKKLEENRKAQDEKNTKTKAEKEEMERQLEMESAKSGDLSAKLQKVNAETADLQSELESVQSQLAEAEEDRNRLASIKRKTEQEVAGVRKEAEDVALRLAKAEQDKSTKDHQLRTLNDEMSKQDELINKLQKEKKQLQELTGKSGEELLGADEKVNHLNKVKAKLEQTLDELEDSLDREKRLKVELEKQKRKIEGDVKLTQEALGDLERNKKELETTLQRKDKDIQAQSLKLEDSQSLVSKLQKQVKELQARIEELEEELEAERQARAKAEKQRSDLSRELEEIQERLDEAGGATAAQIELNKKREAELGKLRRDLEESNIQQEAALTAIRKKQNDAMVELAEQIDTLGKMKVKAERERAAMGNEVNEVRAAMDQVSNENASQDKMNKMMQNDLQDLNYKYEDALRTFQEMENNTKKLASENNDLCKQKEDCDQQVAELSKIKLDLATKLEEAKRIADDETRDRALLLTKFRNVEHQLDSQRQAVDEEAEGKANLQRICAKASAEAQLWRYKYEVEGVAKAEELEETKRKLQARLAECEEVIQSLHEKVTYLEKSKQRLATELEDLQLEAERLRSLANQLEKKQAFFDKTVEEWSAKVDGLSVELDASQRECRNYSTELFRLRALLEEATEQGDTLHRENKNLSEEIKDLMDQIGEGGRAIHEMEKHKRRLEAEKDELQCALEEAESALEQEENKLLKGQLELSQVKADIERRIQEKEEEFENTRKNHQKTLEALQGRLEEEAKAKAEALRMKKKLESDIQELEQAVEQANETLLKSHKTIKNYQAQLKEIQQALEQETLAHEETKEARLQVERRANALANELDESRTLLEQTDRARREAEKELAEGHETITELEAQAESLSSNRRKLEAELQTLHQDLEEILREARISEEKAQRAMLDAARLSDELRAEQEHAQFVEKERKSMELAMKDLQARVNEAEANALKAGKKTIAKLEERIRLMESELDTEQRRHSDAQKNLRKGERQIRELIFQSEEDRKNHERMQELVDKLQQKIRSFQRQIEEAEEIAALNLAKFRKAQQELEESECRVDMAEQQLAKHRARARGESMARAQSSSRQ